MIFNEKLDNAYITLSDTVAHEVIRSGVIQAVNDSLLKDSKVLIGLSIHVKDYLMTLDLGYFDKETDLYNEGCLSYNISALQNGQTTNP